MSLLLADGGGQVVEEVALVAGDGVAIAVVGPGRDKQHLPVGASIKHLPAGFPIWRESVLEQLDEGKACLLNHIHYGLLAWTDAGRHEHGAALSHHQETFCRMFYLIVGHSSGTFYDNFVRAVEQETVAHDGDAQVADHDVLLCFEEFWVVALGPQAARVVVQVLEHGIELPPALQDAVVIAFFPERRQRHFFGHTVATDLEAVDDVPQMARKSFCDMDDSMQMIGHELKSEQLDLRIVLGYLAPTCLDAFP